ncbi:MAG: hypothetical protein P0Y55_15395 [Candidatus Cohnella colombiensis]|uniref:Uncharacterized protein n=1 Tax=Candidatus Cohnella colombiensis TaxID=3121368 RepID=A0AA95F379_9BACL|nr:MAG: hypothetical protein P0Y55_15395 [Cohnella sp.]
MAKKLGYTLLLLLLVVGSFYLGSVTTEADSGTTPGSVDDPLVTKSYVDKKVAEGGGGGSSGAVSKLEVVTVPLGKTIIVADGGELIVRSGKAIAVSEDANGLSDMTDGLDIAPGKAVATNHLILFPRSGRGVQPDPNQKNGLIVLVRGGYQIK